MDHKLNTQGYRTSREPEMGDLMDRELHPAVKLAAAIAVFFCSIALIGLVCAIISELLHK